MYFFFDRPVSQRRYFTLSSRWEASKGSLVAQKAGKVYEFEGKSSKDEI